jgi:hypothetical protein
VYERHTLEKGALIMQRVRLTRILAPLINGVDLSRYRVGDVLLLPEAVAAMLIRENYAELASDSQRSQGKPRRSAVR